MSFFDAFLPAGCNINRPYNGNGRSKDYFSYELANKQSKIEDSGKTIHPNMCLPPKECRL
jgi:hypothetical protein